MERRTPKIIIKIEMAIMDLFILLFTYVSIGLVFQKFETNPIDFSFIIFTSIIVGISIGILALFSVYRMLLKHFGFQDILRIFTTVIVKNLSFMLVFLIFPKLSPFKFYDFLALIPIEIFVISLPRIIPRAYRYITQELSRQNGLRTLIIGAGSGGSIVLREIIDNKQRNNKVIGFVDDNPNKIGSRMSGIKVYGPIINIKEIIKQTNAEEVIIAIKSLKTKSLSGIVRDIIECDVSVKKMQVLSDISKDNVVSLVKVNVEDLLNREPISLDNEEISNYLSGKVILVTGGGGSIGSELCRQIVTYHPKQLIIFDIYENSTYDIQMELLRLFQKQPEFSCDLKVVIGSVYNYERIKSVFETYRPNIVFHAAAYKHVPLMEDAPIESLRTNVVGTYNVAILVDEYKADKMVLVSTDKAVRPTSIMGACKRYAEHIIQNQNQLSKHSNYSAVRFGNVLGSNGSVIPLFKKQIEDGGPVTVTHKDITRFFMIIPEAVSLILQSAVYAQGGEIFVLDMGEPVKILDLAERMIRLAGYIPYKDIDIKITGLRPGEKLFEELLIDTNSDRHKRTDNEKIFIEHESHLSTEALNMSYISKNIDTLTNEDAVSLVKSIIKTYDPENGQEIKK